MAITIPIRVPVPNVTEMLTRYDQIKVFKAPEEDASLSVELTSASTRLHLSTGQHLYVYQDHTGELTDWYQTAFYNSATDEESPRSPLRSAQGDYTQDVVTVQELKNIFLAGIPLVSPEGTPYPDYAFRYWIRAAVSELERRLNIPLRELKVVNEPHEYCAQDYHALSRIKLFHRPLVSIQEVRVVSTAGGGTSKIPLEWIRSRASQASFQTVPTTAVPVSSMVLTGGVSYFASINMFLTWLPGVFQVDYTAGFKKGDIPPELKRLAGMMAAIDPLRVLGDTILGPGLSGGKISLDDLMTDTRSTKSTRGGAFQGRIDSYQKEIERLIKSFELKFGGVSWVVA